MVMTDILFKKSPERIMKERGCFKEPGVQDFLSGVFPQSLYYVEIRGIRREENQVDSKLGGFLLYCLAVLVPGIVKYDGHRDVSTFIPHLFKKVRDLLGIHIYHGVGVNEFQGKRIDGSEQVEPVSSGTGGKIKRSLAPYLAGEGSKGEMHGIHEQQPSYAFHCLGYDRLDVCDPFLLLLRIGLARNRLKFPVIHLSIAHEHSRPCETECMATDLPDDADGFLCASRDSFDKSIRHCEPLTRKTVRASSFFFDEENVLQSTGVICVNDLVYEIAAGAGESCNGLASHPGILHLCQKSPASLSYDCAVTGTVDHSFKSRYDIFRIFDG